MLWGVTFLTYVVMNLLPGDTAQLLLGANATPAEPGSRLAPGHFAACHFPLEETPR